MSIPRSSALEVKVSGLAPDRYVVTCNGRRHSRCDPRAAKASSSPACAIRAWQPCVRTASDNRRSFAADIRYSRHLDEAIGGRLSISCRPSGRPQPRDLSRQRIRGGKPAARALFSHRPHAGPNERRAGRRERGVSLYPGPAQSSITEAIRRLQQLPQRSASLRRAVGRRGPRPQPLAVSGRRHLRRRRAERRGVPPSSRGA